MKKLIVFLSVVVLFSLNACTEKINLEAEKEKARTVLEQYHKALEIEDMEMISTLYAHDDDIVQFNDGGNVIGWGVMKSLKFMIQAMLHGFHSSKMVILYFEINLQVLRM